MYDLSRHPYFAPWKDPETGITSYILKERVAPLQQHFYFTNVSISPDEKWLWFQAAHPPAPYKCLAVVSLDPANAFIRYFPEAYFNTAHPMVAPESNAIYFGMGPSVWKMGLSGTPAKVCTLPDSYINHRQLHRLATHLTMSADGKNFLLDGALGDHWFVGLGSLAGGEVKILKEFSMHYNHAQFSPIDPDIFLIAQDWFFDRDSGVHFRYDNRVWLMDTTGERFELLQTHDYSKKPRLDSHEWWTRDGRIAYVNYETGVFRIDLKTRKHEHVWKQPLCHAHCDPGQRYWVADESPYKWDKTPCQVRFFDARLQAQTNICSGMPRPTLTRNAYHLDPHPQFSPQGSYVIYTTTVRDPLVDIAITPVQPVADLLQSQARPGRRRRSAHAVEERIHDAQR